MEPGLNVDIGEPLPPPEYIPTRVHLPLRVGDFSLVQPNNETIRSNKIVLIIGFGSEA
jgi:hypothetical protein